MFSRLAVKMSKIKETYANDSRSVKWPIALRIAASGQMKEFDTISPNSFWQEKVKDFSEIHGFLKNKTAEA